MKSVTIVKVLVVVFAFSRTFVSGVFLSPGVEHGGQGGQGTGTQRYDREFLISLQTPQVPSDFPFELFPAEMTNGVNARKRRKRGERGGVKRRMRRNKTKLPLPSMIVSNVRSINPKSPNHNFDELLANCRFTREFRDASLLCFSETWFMDKVTNESVEIFGFGEPYRTDRDSRQTGKERGGGVCLYVSEKFCDRANVTVKQRMCTPELELISLSLRPRYLPREFGRIFVTVVYAAVYDSTSAARAGKAIAAAVRDLQLISADAPCFIVGDFNHCDLHKALPSFRQFVTCPTRVKNTTNLCYVNIPRAYKSVSLPPVGKSDHNSIHLIPAYRPKIETDPIVKKSVKVWTSESEEQLRGCFECTEWSVLVDSCENVSEAADVVSSYIGFCEDMLISTKIVKVFPNNKTWISKSIKSTLNEKKIAFQTGDRAERKRVQAKLTRELREGKREYRAKVERDDLGEDINSVVLELKEKISECEEGKDFEINASVVESMFTKLNVKKAAGPDSISGKLLKVCASQLCSVFANLFNWSLRECCVASVWKNSVICPVPKKKNPSSLNDYRPVALTSMVMKCFEKLVLRRLLTFTNEHLDPLQFAYKPHRGTDDAILTVLHNAFLHLDKAGSYVRMLFIDFSSTFNTIQPHLLALKLLHLDVNPKLILWIVNFLLHRSQSVRFQNSISSQRHTCTGAPQGTVLSPALFTLYTNDCQGTTKTPIVKYSDDTVIEDLSNSDSVYFSEVHNFSAWCKENYLDLNIVKTKEMVVDFREKNPHQCQNLS